MPNKKTGPPARNARAGAARSGARSRFTRRELVEFERALLEEKKRILRQGKATDEVMESSGTDATSGEPTRRTHVAEIGGENYQVEMASRLKEMEGRTLREITQALERIANGTYGNCDLCGKPIPRARLEIVPHARLCMKCSEGR
ncbi:MAG: TraR/DksA C4-type zinc finger protein [bacterium]